MTRTPLPTRPPANGRASRPSAGPDVTRCAIYTRKSSEEGLQQDFNSLDAQREAAEAYITSQKAEGWTCLPDRYDDGGFTGGNLDRPAAQRLLKDIEASRVDCVVVYKVDRLSRSLMDFARMMETFERHKVSFVSVTQQFNTTHSMGRLTLNILLSFAQFEREIIGERTRDKIAATRRKGRWTGGKPLLGFDLDVKPGRTRLVVNHEEAQRVRAIFDLYLQEQSLIRTVTEMRRLGWTNKRWTTRAGKDVGGQEFDKVQLFRMLTNVLYVGKVRYHEEVHPGEHDAIVDEEVWRCVDASLRTNGRAGGPHVRNKHGALLKGLLRCAPCGCAMGHTYSVKRSGKAYRYYTCQRAQKNGWDACPSKAVPAGEMEAFVVEQIRAIGRDPSLIVATLDAAREQEERLLAELDARRRATERELTRLHAAMGRAVKGSARGAASGEHLAELQEQVSRAEQELADVTRAIDEGLARLVSREEVGAALGRFDGVWSSLSPREQGRVLRLLLASVEYDGGSGKIRLVFRPNGLRDLAQDGPATRG